MRKMKLETVISNLERVQKDVETHAFDFGKAVTENTTEEHEKIKQAQDIMNNINANLVGKEKDSAQAEMISLVQEVFAKANGNVDEARGIIERAINSGSDETKPADNEESAEDDGTSSGSGFDF